jgi:hypothetical protein
VRQVSSLSSSSTTFSPAHMHTLSVFRNSHYRTGVYSPPPTDLREDAAMLNKKIHSIKQSTASAGVFEKKLPGETNFRTGARRKVKNHHICVFLCLFVCRQRRGEPVRCVF